MIAYEDFGANVEAHLIYAGGRPLEEQVQILSRRLQDGSWMTAPTTWIDGLARLIYGSEPQMAVAAVLRADLVAQLIKHPFEASKMERVVHEVLPRLVEDRFGLTEAQTQQIVTWFIQQAGPGKASLAADVLNKVYLHHPSNLPHWRPFQPLAEWLTLNGSAELRSKRRAGLVLILVEVAHRLGDELQTLVHRLRYLVLNESGVPNPWFPPTTPLRSKLFDALEHALAQGASLSLVKDVILASPAAGVTETLQVLLDPKPEYIDYPRIKGALVRALIQGSFTAKTATEAWRAAFWSPFPSEPFPGFRTSEALDAALEALNLHSAFGFRYQHGELHELSPSNARAWARYLATEAIRIYGLSDACHSTTNPHRLGLLSAYNAHISRGVRDAVYAAILSAPDSAPFALARTILEEAPDEQRATFAAIKAITRDSVPRAGEPHRPDLMDRLHSLLLTIVHQPWTEPVFGIDLAKLLGPATNVDFVELEQDDSVRIGQGVVQVDRRSIKSAISLPWEEEARLALGALYFFHELIHRAQGIHTKAMVDPLHAAGAESTLLHVDLGADHAAVLLAARAMPRWSLVWLKDLQGRSLVNFPVGRFHTPAARARKAQRLVGVRLDYLARASSLLAAEVLGEGYLFSDFGPAGGAFLVLRSGPPVSLVGAGTLTPKEAELLSMSADEEQPQQGQRGPELRGDRLARVDDLLRRQLEQMVRSRS